MTRESAGVLYYRRDTDGVRVLLAHPGGPYWKSRDEGAWTLPKGGLEAGETAEQAARREFAEEMGSAVNGQLIKLGRVRQRGGKWVEAFACDSDFDTGTLHSATFEMEWPPRSGRMIEFPEIDRAAWFTVSQARLKILESQSPFLDWLQELLQEGVAHQIPSPAENE